MEVIVGKPRTEPSMREFKFLCMLDARHGVSLARLAEVYGHHTYVYVKRLEGKGFVVETTEGSPHKMYRRTDAGNEYVKSIGMLALPKSLEECPWIFRRR